MKKFDKWFNDVDPETGRPFSGGFPDGAWIIGIVYSLSMTLCIIAAVWALVQKPIMLPLVWVLLIAFLVHGAVVVCLFLRSVIALFIDSLLSIFIGVFAAYALLNGLPNKFLVLGIFLAHGYISFYIAGLVRDKILFKQGAVFSKRISRF